MAAFVRSNPADDALLLQFLYMLGNGSPYNSKRICHLLGCHFRVFSDKLKDFLCTFLCTFLYTLWDRNLSLGI